MLSCDWFIRRCKRRRKKYITTTLTNRNRSLLLFSFLLLLQYLASIVIIATTLMNYYNYYCYSKQTSDSFNTKYTTILLLAPCYGSAVASAFYYKTTTTTILNNININHFTTIATTTKVITPKTLSPIRRRQSCKLNACIIVHHDDNNNNRNHITNNSNIDNNNGDDRNQRTNTQQHKKGDRSVTTNVKTTTSISKSSLETSIRSIQQIEYELQDFIKLNSNSNYDIQYILQKITHLYQIYNNNNNNNTRHVKELEQRLQLCNEIDCIIQEFLIAIFTANNYNNDNKSNNNNNNNINPQYRQQRIMIGLYVLENHLSSLSSISDNQRMITPYHNTVSRRILTNAITAITNIIIQGYYHDDTSSTSTTIRATNIDPFTQNISSTQSIPTTITTTPYTIHSQQTLVTQSYRMLQRLISGVGVRDIKNNCDRNSKQYQNNKQMATKLSEKEFNQVLHAYCKVGYMNAAERIVKLQQCVLFNNKEVPVSLVTYSILLKGYGAKMDINNVEHVIQRTKLHYTELDTIMINTILDAYINCDAVEKADELFHEMKSNSNNQNSIILNQRTYNTIMKGYAKRGAIETAILLSNEMKYLHLWDAITTNTLVHAAINAGNLTYAEEILERETIQLDKSNNKKYYKQHPNVEAYTELLDAYAKRNQLDRSLSVLQTMQRRNVEPNVVTYTCLMGGLGRSNRIDLANKIFDYMISKHVSPTTKMYNALLSGLLDETTLISMQDLDQRVDESIRILRDMKKTVAIPDSTTISVIIDAMGRCTNPRIDEAQLLVDDLIRKNLISISDNKVWTSMIRLYGRAKHFQGVVQAFQQLVQPDTVAVNAYMDACSRCGREKAVIEAFNNHFRQNTLQNTILLHPDVVTYATIIGTILHRSYLDEKSIRYVRMLYLDMKNRCKIHPDNGLIDILLKSMIRIGASRQLTKDHIILIIDILQDAEFLPWEDGQLNRRKRAIGAVLSDCFGSQLRPNDPILKMIPADTLNDELFNRKGWNQVNSGFKLWGGITSSKMIETNRKDAFLHSHGWNDVDSTFRLF